MITDTLVLPTKRGHTINARLRKSKQAPKGIAVIACALGIPQHYYRHFAQWLSDQGYDVITFDYEGIGLSRNGPIKECKATIASWAKYDCAAVLDYVNQNYPDLKCTWIGHSAGGKMVGMIDDPSRIDKVITVASGIGHWWDVAPGARFACWLSWYFIVPVVVPLVGYFPGKKLKIVGDLPIGVIQQWRKWSMNRDYFYGMGDNNYQDNFESVSVPITGFLFTDDELMSPKNIVRLNEMFTQAPKTMHKVKPEDIDQKRIGHNGWAKSRCQKLWENHLAKELESVTP